MAQYLRQNYGTVATPQSEPIPGKDMVKNSAGGYAFKVGDWGQLRRFLVLGTEGGTYYAGERKLTRQNLQVVERCLQEDGQRVAQEIVAISESGRAPKNDPALYALAMCAGMGSLEVKRSALAVLPKVARTGTHLLRFVAYCKQFRGWGRGLRTAIGKWYVDRSAEQVAYQVAKYQSRDRWAQRDLLRLAHPVPPTEQHKAVFHWVTQGWESVGSEPPAEEALKLIWALERAKTATGKDRVVLIRDYGLTHEMIPTEWKREAVVWEALLDKMPLTAMIRGLANMTRVGLLVSLSNAVSKVVAELSDADRIKKARVHPIAILSALKTYAQGHGERSDNTWQPVSQVVDALDRAFYLAFGNVTPTNKRWNLALDVSGSMDGGVIAGVPGLTPRVASAAMALVTANVEPNYVVTAFTAGSSGYSYNRGQNTDGIKTLSISPRQRLDDVVKVVSELDFGGTDCALPMLWAMQNKVRVDVFAVYTDSEIWAGTIHPIQALDMYRQKMSVPARLAVIGMTSTGFSIADPMCDDMLDIVGLDTATPEIMSMFATGQL